MDDLDELFLEVPTPPFRAFFPAAPAEASAFTRLTPFVPPARPPGGPVVADGTGT